ncbi:hypothetical protein [Acidiphilium acidophilum]|uniref:hypothetical protein n=1 Tax=Acidiphilium acidophilum TaxID=76588 RepID=UPI002E8E6C77|nr:hypothetical protein [Acidiphilium acidophilum]
MSFESLAIPKIQGVPGWTHNSLCFKSGWSLNNPELEKTLNCDNSCVAECDTWSMARTEATVDVGPNDWWDAEEHLIDPLILIPQLSFEENREGRVGFSKGIWIG